MRIGKPIGKSLVFGITAMFIVSSFVQMAAGYNKTISDRKLDDDCFENYVFDRCDESQTFDFSDYKKQIFYEHPDDDFTSEEILEQTSSITSDPMDSPWPMKCHDNRHTSRSPYSTACNSGFEKWRFKCEEVESSAVIDDDGTIYFGDQGTSCSLWALYPNGTKKWRYPTGMIIWSTPAIAEDGTIYVTSYDDYLHAVNPDGTLKWKFSADDCSSSPAIAEDGTIYFGVMGPGNKGRTYAVDSNGTEKWHYDTGFWIVSDPAVGDDGTVYIGSGDTYLYALYPNGTLRWRFKTGDYVKGHPSIADDGTIYIPSFDDYLYALHPNGTMKWKVNTGWGASSSAAIGEDRTVYIGTNKLRAIYPNNGTVKWSLDVGGDIAHASLAISAGGTIYVSAGKSLVAVNPDGTEKWRREICNLRADSSPCIGEDGTIYVGSSQIDENTHMWFGYLHAFGAGGELKADANGPYYGLINLPVQFSGTASYGYPPYTWLWDFGNDETSDEQNPAHIYTNPGNYTVTLTVTDDSGNTSEDTTWAWIQASNDPPDKPSITGETNGKAGTKYNYTFVTTDPEGLKVWYYIEWGDDKDTGWIGPYPSGEEITESHSWSKKDTYVIRCKAKDPYGAESEWGELEVTMPVNKAVDSPFFNFIESHFPRLFWFINYLFIK